jgi:hypothetical protein
LHERFPALAANEQRVQPLAWLSNELRLKQVYKQKEIGAVNNLLCEYYGAKRTVPFD